MMLSDVCLSDDCLSVAYIGTKSRTRETKIGTEVANVTRDPDTTFKVKRSKVKVTRPLYSPPCNASDSCSGERGNVLAVGNYCYVAVCSAARGASTPTEGGEGRGISWRPPAYSNCCIYVAVCSNKSPRCAAYDLYLHSQKKMVSSLLREQNV